ncbi:MAG TPA: C1 family peptidase, partial [Phycisphaerae bacterium]|nr:C1 family peptidase [Phycisphaerae bacterium]HNU47168.1 C1 family peptidase [Phycisphaerae bacterium]
MQGARQRRGGWYTWILTIGVGIWALGFAGSTTALGQLTQADIDALRQQGEEEGWTFTVGLNDATQYPLEKLCGYHRPDNWRELGRFDNAPASRSLPASFDWRDYGGLPPARNQGNCGSCWAFSTMGALECNIKVVDGVSTDLSEQWLVSCNSDGWGCDGGFFAHDYLQWKTDPCGDSGAPLESNFPYVAYDAPCNCPYTHVYWITDWAYVGSSTTALKQAIYDHGPISVDVYANSAMQGYTGGIFNGCQSGITNHAVVLVGWDDNQGTGVWFMRNSWGTGWGENGGYMRIPYGCSNIGSTAAYVVYPGTQPQLTFSYPYGRPDMTPPYESTSITVDITAGTGHPAANTAKLYYRLDGGSWVMQQMTRLSTYRYQGTLPGAECFATYDWYVGADMTEGGTDFDPDSAPASYYSTLIATGTAVLFTDDFQTNQGWTVTAGATLGNWERADPAPVLYDGTNYSQPGDDHTPAPGTLCYVTGPLAGSGAGSYDVD